MALRVRRPDLLEPQTFIAFAAVGLFAGTIASLLGVGGGIVFMPAVFYYYSLSSTDADFAVKSAVATSLAMIVFTAMSGGLGHLRKGNYVPGALRWLVPGSVAGAAAGSHFALIVHGESIKAAYAVFLFIIAIQMAFGKDSRRDCEEAGADNGVRIQAIPLLLVGLVSGVLSGFVGGGGGVIIVPALYFLTRSSITKCVGESTLLIIFTSVAGTTRFILTTPPGIEAPLMVGYVNVAICAAMVPAAILGARLGVTISSRVNPNVLRRAFSGVCVLIGLEMTNAFALIQNYLR
jgi:hypothetical protein